MAQGFVRRSTAAARASRQLDKQIEAIYVRRFSGHTINILDIPKVFAAGRMAAAAGADIEAAIVACVEGLSCRG